MKYFLQFLLVLLCISSSVLQAQDSETLCGIEEKEFASFAALGVNSLVSTGPKTAVVLLLDFPDKAGIPVALTTAKTVLGQVEGYFPTVSYGKTNVKFTLVEKVLRMPRNSSEYAPSNHSLLRQDAIAAATAAGINTAQYPWVVLAFAKLSYGWAGLASWSSNGTGTNWINGAFTFGVVAHEVGHLYGLPHAGALESGAVVVGGSSGQVEYGDVFDVMGNRAQDATYHFNEAFKNRLGWIADNQVKMITASGTYKLYAHDYPTAGATPLALRIKSAAGRDYWLSYRTALNNANLRSGLGIRLLDYAGSGKTSLLDLTPNSTSANNDFFDSPLAVGQSYSDTQAGFTLKSLRTGGTGNQSWIEVEITFSANPPTPVSIPAPSNLLASAKSSTTIQLNWTNGAANYDGVEIHRSVDGINYIKAASVAGSAVQFLDQGLTANSKYYYKIRALKGIVYSAFSNVVQVTTPANTPPSNSVAPPSNLIAQVASSSTINLSWKDNSGNETGFEIHRSTDGKNFTRISTVAKNIVTFQDKSLQANTVYYYSLRAYTGTSFSNFSNVAQARTSGATGTTSAGAPSDLVASFTADKRINLRWKDNSVGEDAFEIAMSMDQINYTIIGRVGQNMTNVIIGGKLPDGAWVSFRVRAKLGSQTSNYSNTASVRILLPAPTTLFAKKEPNQSAVILTWRDNSWREEGFIVQRSLDGVKFETIGRTARGATSYIDRIIGNNIGRKVYYRVLAFNGTYNSGASNLANIDGSLPALAIATDYQTDSLLANEIFAYSLYPNPAENYVNVEMTENQVGVELYLRNAAGQTVRTTRLNKGVRFYAFDLENLATGVYILSIVYKNQTFSKRLVIGNGLTE